MRCHEIYLAEGIVPVQVLLDLAPAMQALSGSR